MNQKGLKDVLKKMPIWDYHDQVKLKFEMFEHELDSYVERQDKNNEKLPNIDSQKNNLLSSSNSMNTNSSDQDLISTYKKSAYGEVNRVKERQNKVFTNEDCPPGESMAMLEKKLSQYDEVYAQYEQGKKWVKCTVMNITRKPVRQLNKSLVIFRLKVCSDQPKIDLKNKNIDVCKFAVARIQNHGNSLCVSKRVIAGPSTSKMLPGIIGQQPCEDNANRYLVLMDDGSARYYNSNQIYPIFYQSTYPWQDINELDNYNRNILAQLRAYFYDYPRRNILACNKGDDIKLFRNGTLVSAEVIDIDVDTMTVLYKDNTEESIHRGSPRLISSLHEKCLQVAKVNNLEKLHGDLLLAMARYHKAGVKALDEDFYNCLESLDKEFHITATKEQKARKSTGKPYKKRMIPLDDVVVETSLNTAIELDTDMIENSKKHRCSAGCLEVDGVKTESSIKDIVEEFRKVSDLKVPLLLGWKRLLTKVNHKRVKCQVVYIAPCGKVFKQLHEIRRYIIITKSKLDVDYFTLDKFIEMNNPQEVEGYYYIENIAVDKNTRKPLENKYISALNIQNTDTLPRDFDYNNEVVPHKELIKKGFSFNTEFKSSCDCEDDCYQRSTCACHRLTEEFAGKSAFNRGTVDNTCQYNYKRLKDQVNTGIFECNSGCKCSSKCANRVVQNGIRYRLQVMKMPGKKGWGVITKDDIVEGSFVCTYSAELLDDADQYGDSDVYYADLDYITVNEAAKLGGTDDDINEDEGFQASDDENFEKADNNVNIGASCSNGVSSDCNTLDKTNNKRPHISSSSSSEMDLSESEETPDSSKTSRSISSTSISSLELEKTYTPEKKKTNGRYPVRKTRSVFNNQISNLNGASNGNSQEAAVQFKRLHTILKSRDFTLDARMQGNIGRFFNHSCDPNIYVQNVFIETHDLRFPVVAFFANKNIKASTEITWNYNYKLNSIEGRRIDCECGAAKCKGRIL